MPMHPARALLLLVLFATAPIAARADDSQAAAAAPAFTPEQEAFFEKRIRPLLTAKCFECHADQQQKGDVRLDSREGLLKGNEGGPVVVVGKPDESRLMEVIGYRDPVQMPPKGKLADDEIAALTEWVKMGVPFPGGKSAGETPLGQSATPEGIEQAKAAHWAFQPVGRPQPPAVRDNNWAETPIDRFLLAKLEEQGLSPSPRADRRTLLRRVTFDLIGLPPTAEEAAAFENDMSADAWANVVDRLLASPHYGERWGRHWLDVARYADTKGYVFTEERKYPFSYTYRDYVIRAFNNDLPFDRFILEQLAADQMAGDDKTALAAMGFLTLGRRFGNNINDIIDDRIDVVSRGLMGLTVTCARCHDHKYDPIPTDDYYSLYGVFASSVEPADLPQIGEPTLNEAYRAYEQELARREQVVNEFVAVKHRELLDELRSRTGDYLAATLRKDEGRRERGNQSLGPGEVRRPVVERWNAYLGETAKQPHPVFLAWHELAKLPAEGFAEAAAKSIPGLNDAGDAQPRTNAIIKKTLLEASPKSMADVAAAYGKAFADVQQQWVKLQNEKPAEGAAAAKPTALSDPAAEELRQVLYADNGPLAISMDDARRLFDRATRNKASELKREVDSFKANSPAAPPRAMVLNDAPQPVQPHVFIRGNNGRPGKQVPRRFLQVLLPKDAPAFQKGSGRLELAQAIASADNPLTARVLVNRVWMHHFGRGLVATPSDFGARGFAPSHPELLDYLARTFIDDGWSLKKLHRRILLSSAYRQASDDRDDGVRLDPENRLVWKMNRQRVEFEAMRDTLLAVAGRLDTTAGGRPVDLFGQPFVTRRAVYGFIDRQDLPGTLRVFDFASPDVSTPMRPQTTVPQQALFGMNSPFVTEQAQRLAARPEVANQSDAAGKIRALYRLIYSRAPEPDELAAGERFLAESQAFLASGPGGIWQYGAGAYDETAKRVTSFTPLPHFEGKSWRGGPALPDRQFGWVLLTAEGGHPGNDLAHAAVRRFTAPRDGTLKAFATLAHPAEQGDGVRGRIVSSRLGELGSWTVHHGKVDTKVEGVEVKQGDTIDFVVDCLGSEANDSFTWPPIVSLAPVAGSGGRVQQWVAPADFKGPQPAAMSPLEQYAQALLLANEFVFVD